ncbi:hypothetical protein J4526_00920 [Desulfurococcaceae archaeon MEX13E-LK6-19]|nr:hypothetical protein J4526_00920 [Desulfurococcaceae archaeon MEX13E-LK6-19]
MEKHVLTVTIDLNALAHRLIGSKKQYIRPQELAYELSISVRSAGKLLSRLAKMGYVEKWSKNLYRIKH